MRWANSHSDNCVLLLQFNHCNCINIVYNIQCWYNYSGHMYSQCVFIVFAMHYEVVGLHPNKENMHCIALANPLFPSITVVRMLLQNLQFIIYTIVSLKCCVACICCYRIYIFTQEHNRLSTACEQITQPPCTVSVMWHYSCHKIFLQTQSWSGPMRALVTQSLCLHITSYECSPDRDWVWQQRGCVTCSHFQQISLITGYVLVNFKVCGACAQCCYRGQFSDWSID